MRESSIRRIALAAGGTAGHVYPAVAVAEQLRTDCDVFIVGTREGTSREIAAKAHLPFVEIPGSPYYRVNFARRGASIVNLIRGVLAARELLRREKIDAVVGFGGYAAAGTLIAARTLGIWSALLEPNADAGKANRLAARFVGRIYLGIDTLWSDPDDRRLLRVGMPVRQAIVGAQPVERSGAMRLIVFGDEFREIANRLAARMSLSVVQTPVDNIAEEYAKCDFAICRAGASTLAELAIRGIPALIVPLAEAAENHQARNALPYAERGAAIVAKEIDDSVIDSLTSLLLDEERLCAMSRNMRAFAAPAAARDLADDIRKHLE